MCPVWGRGLQLIGVGWTKCAEGLQAPKDKDMELGWAVGRAGPAGAPVLGLGVGLPDLGVRK